MWINILLTRRGSQVSASSCFEFWICFRGPKNKIYVFFIAARFHILGMKPPPKIHKNNWYLPPIASVFGYLLEDRKMRYVFFYSCPFSYLGVKPPPKVHTGYKIVLSKTWYKFNLRHNLLYGRCSCRQSPLLRGKYEGWFHPLNMQMGQNKKIRIFYFSVL